VLLTDGGIVENLGVQTLLRSQRFGAPRIVVSDAGIWDRPWQPQGLIGRVRHLAISGLSVGTLERLLLIMNDKQNRSMRQIAFRDRAKPPPSPTSHGIWFIRLAQTWRSLMAEIPDWHLGALGIGPIKDAATRAAQIEGSLARVGIDLRASRATYDAMGGDAAVTTANEITTNFAALSSDHLDLLCEHARWQVLLVAKLYP
jgi:hypothetical protein